MKISQLSTFIENRSGRLHAACEALAARGINIHTLCLADSRDFGILRLIVADPPAGKAALEAAGYVAQLTDVLAVEVHQNNVGSSDIVFGASLRLEGGDVVPFTPGQPNNVVLDLPEFPSVYLTEIVPLNQSGITNANGQREPWLELANLGSEPVSLEGWFLSDSVTQLNRWSFPAGATLPPNSRVVVFADGQAGTGTEWHTSFRLNASTGVVLLSRTQPGGVAVVDYLRYFDAPADRAAVPDLDRPAGASRWTEPTPGTDLPAPLGTLAAELDGTGVVLRWSTQVGRTYRVEFQSDLTAPTWTFWQDVVGTGAPVTVRDPLISGRNERHYRIRLLP